MPALLLGGMVHKIKNFPPAPARSDTRRLGNDTVEIVNSWKRVQGRASGRWNRPGSVLHAQD
jgi:hypothetical protein